MYASYGLLRCQHFSSPRPPMWRGRGLSSGCSKSQELQKAKLNKLENWNSKATRLSVPSPFASVLVENKDSGGRALFPVYPSCITLRKRCKVPGSGTHAMWTVLSVCSQYEQMLLCPGCSVTLQDACSKDSILD